MAAVQVLASASTTIVAARNEEQSGIVRNLGPNRIYVESAGAAATATSYPLDPGEAVAFYLKQQQALTGRAVTADQVSPNDTRVLLSGAFG